MTDLQADIDRGEKAARLLADPVLSQAFDDVRSAIIELWEQCPIRDREGQHELKLQLKLLSDVRANLERAIDEGKAAVRELEQSRREKPTPQAFSDSWRI